jgi:exoribonuclease II
MLHCTILRFYGSCRGPMPDDPATRLDRALQWTMNRHPPYQRQDLVRIARQAMLERGLATDFPPEVTREVAALTRGQPSLNPTPAEVADLRALLWCSIDNDDSRDLDQLTCSETGADGKVHLRIAIADVDALVPQGSSTDVHAGVNTTSVYTSAVIFPMLPEHLSTDLSSLAPGQDRLAIVTEMTVLADGRILSPRVYRAWVHNHAQLAYDAVSAWLTGDGPLPAAAQAVPGMDQQLHTQDEAAQSLRTRRRAQGSLEFETFQPRAVFEADRVVDMRQQVQNRARQLIEELMIATNTCTAHFLARQGLASIRRVVRSPERWLRIVEVARRHGEALPPLPDAQALQAFLARQYRADPLRFPDLSLVIVKLMGSGEYVVESPGSEPIGHFGLAERDYTHSTAPNRRYPDLITQRMIKAALAGGSAPYSGPALARLALHCTQQEDAARKVERRLRKSEAALCLMTRVGERFAGLVTGLNDAGAWVRIFSPPAEGRLSGQLPALDVGQQVRVQLSSTDVERGFIDFELIRD